MSRHAKFDPKQPAMVSAGSDNMACREIETVNMLQPNMM